MAFGGWLNDIFGGADTAVAPSLAPPSQGGSGTAGYGGFSLWTQPAAAAESTDYRPSSAEATLLAKAVRAKGDKMLKDSWDKLKAEFEVQCRVWDSLTTTAASAEKSGAAKATADVAKALAGPEEHRQKIKTSLSTLFTAAEKDASAPVAHLKSYSKEAAVVELLNHATVSAAHDVFKADRVRKLCDRLGQTLEAAVTAPAPTQEAKKEHENLLAACRLQEPALISKVRKALGLGPTKAEIAKMAQKEKEAELKAHQQVIHQVAKAADCSPEKAAAALESSDGDPNRALVMILSEEEEKQMRKAAELAEKQRVKREEAEQFRQDRFREGNSLASTISSLAASTVTLAWSKVQSEFEVQMNIWDSLAATRGNGGAAYSPFQLAMENVLVNAMEDPAGSVLLLESVLADIVSSRSLALSSGMMVAADGVLDAQRVADCRRQLAAKLRFIAQQFQDGRTLEYGFLERELKELVKSSDLDWSLSNRVLDLSRPKPIVKAL